MPSNTPKLEIVVLAAGQGKRMYSARPKVLHEITGRPLLAHVLDCACALAPQAIHVVYGHGGEQVRAAFPGAAVAWVHQAEQLGTGHAVAQAIGSVNAGAVVLVLYGDVPLIKAESLRPLIDAARADRLAVLTCELEEPGDYGRVLRGSDGKVQRIVERKDAHNQELAIREINTGFMAAPARRLASWLATLRNDNAQGEYYLTDIIVRAVAEGVEVETRRPGAVWEILGVNSQSELAHLERVQQSTQAQQLLAQGVTLRDPARFDLRGTLKAGRDVVIDVNVVLEGEVELGDGVYLAPNNFIRNAKIGARTQILPNCVIEDAVIGADCRLGPFARLRPGNRIADHVHIGNFVEVKNSNVGEGSKMNHLSYIGDTDVGRRVNVGAGTITCNYDGANKHRTVIKDGAFIGSDVQLIAPVTVGEDATIGAGSTIARDAPDGELTLSRAEQKTVKGWKRPKKKVNSDR